MNKHHKNSEIDSFETWHIKKTIRIGIWSHCRCYVGQYIYAFAIFFLRFSYSLMQFPPSILKLSTQHPPYFFKLSTQHQAAITRFENRIILPTQGLQFSYILIRAFSKISAYTKTVQFYSTENTSMNKFLAQSSSPCLMLGGIPPASLSEGWVCLVIRPLIARFMWPTWGPSGADFANWGVTRPQWINSSIDKSSTATIIIPLLIALAWHTVRYRLSSPNGCSLNTYFIFG